MRSVAAWRFETRLPGLAGWGRVLDCARVSCSCGSERQHLPRQSPDADDILGLGNTPLVIATGSRWHVCCTRRSRSRGDLEGPCLHSR